MNLSPSGPPTPGLAESTTRSTRLRWNSGRLGGAELPSRLALRQWPVPGISEDRLAQYRLPLERHTARRPGWRRPISLVRAGGVPERVRKTGITQVWPGHFG